MNLRDRFLVGVRMDYGDHTFTAEAIMAFARKFDPQPFHVDPVAAKASIFGALCASGWHTAAVWMKKNVEFRSQWEAMHEAAGIAVPVFGPSPGLRNLTWTAPVFDGDTVHYYNTVTDVTRRRNNPDWGTVELYSEGFNQHGDRVIGFDNAVLFRI